MSIASINKHLQNMRAAGKLKNNKAKGAAGEAAALDVVHDYRTRHGGILKTGFMYPYASNRQNQVYLGNIFYDEEKKKYYDVTRQLNDEIDILYISYHRVFPIEVKAYHDSSLVCKDSWMYRRGAPMDKSPIAQAEKHARHLYHQIYEVLPDGDPSYICPLVCFVDECEVDDQRSPEAQFYLPVVVLNQLKTKLQDMDSPKGYTIDLDMMEKKLRAIERERTL